MNKFKIGDKVRWTFTTASWQDMIVSELPGKYSNNYIAKDKNRGDGAFKEEELELLSNTNKIDSEFTENNGGATDYYKLPEGASQLNDLIEAKNMPFWRGNIFKATYRLGEKDAATEEYDLNKIIYFANRRLAMLKKDKE